MRVEKIWKSSWELNMSDKVGRLRWRRKKRETRGERLTLFSDQRTEYRLERQKKERCTENRKQWGRERARQRETEVRESDGADLQHRCVLTRQVAAGDRFILGGLNYRCHMYTAGFSAPPYSVAFYSVYIISYNGLFLFKTS